MGGRVRRVVARHDRGGQAVGVHPAHVLEEFRDDLAAEVGAVLHVLGVALDVTVLAHFLTQNRSLKRLEIDHRVEQDAAQYLAEAIATTSAPLEAVSFHGTGTVHHPSAPGLDFVHAVDFEKAFAEAEGEGGGKGKGKGKGKGRGKSISATVETRHSFSPEGWEPVLPERTTQRITAPPSRTSPAPRRR